MTKKVKKEKNDFIAKKESYQPPAVISEEVFETLAVTCGKGGGIQCQISGGFTS